MCTNKETVKFEDGMQVRASGVSQLANGGVLVNVSDIVGEDGLSDKERNAKIGHNIPLLAMVELVSDPGDGPSVCDGLRLFVQEHSRDCDGTPLYNLTTDWRLCFKEVKRPQAYADSLERMHWWSVTGKIVGGYAEDSLKVIYTREQIMERLIDHGWFDADGNPLEEI